MSGGSRDSYSSSYTRAASYSTPARREERSKHLEELRHEAPKKSPAAMPRRDESEVIRKDHVRKTITRPKAGVSRVHIVLVDNSGSNRKIAEHIRKSSGYLSASLHAIDPTSQIAFIYFSDHCDDENIMQEVDFVSSDAEGDSILASTTAQVQNASGGDEPEAIECALKRACEIDFGSASNRYLYLITDVVAHGMGMHGDDGCPDQVNWKRSVERVNQTFTTFEVIGCGDDSAVSKLQRQFLSPEHVALRLIDLSMVRETRHRQAITVNTLLFLIARHVGKQALQMFLGALYEKWLSEPIFGDDTDRRAREMIKRFGEYIDLPIDEIKSMMNDILD